MWLEKKVEKITQSLVQMKGITLKNIYFFYDFIPPE